MMKRSLTIGSIALLAMALVLGLAGRGLSADAPKAAGSTVSGKISGIDGKAAAGATVRLMAAEAAKPKGGKAGKGVAADKGGNKAGKAAALQEVTSDADGTFKFSDVPAGSYRIVAAIKGQGRGQTTVTVTDGQNVDNLEIKLQAGKKKGN